MTPLTSRQVQSDIYQFLRDSALSEMISGEVYRNGMRPRGSKAEDAVVTFITGMIGETQTGVVAVNIFVPDCDPYTCARSNYKFRLNATIQTFEESATHEHFVSVRLGYEYWNK